MLKLILPLTALLAACAAEPPLTRAPRTAARLPSSSDDALEPSDSNGNEAWTPVYGNAELRDLARNHLSTVKLDFYEAPSTETSPAVEGNIAGSFSGLRANADFPYFAFASVADAQKFLQKNAEAPKPYVSQLYEFNPSGACLVVQVIDHYWQEPSSLFGFRAGRRIYGEHLKNFLLNAGTLRGAPQEMQVPLDYQRLCVGDTLQANGHTLKIAQVSSSLGLNTSSAPGATYPTYPAVLLADESGQAYLTESNGLRRLKNLNRTGKTAAQASSDTHTCGKSTHATSEDFAATSAQANERAKAVMAAQCATIGRHLDEGSLHFEAKKYDVCFETGWNQANTIGTGHCQ